MLKINGKSVGNWCLGEKLLRTLSGTFYLTRMVVWDGPKEKPAQLALIWEDTNGELSAMAIEEPGVTSDGLGSYANTCGFQPTEEKEVFVLRNV